MIIEFGNIFVNLFQSIIVTLYLIKSLSIRKEKFPEAVPYIIGIVGTFTYLEVLSIITEFEGVGVFAYCIFSLFFSMAFLEGSLGEKIYVNVILIGILVFSALIGGGIGSLIYGTDYVSYVGMAEYKWFLGAIITQIFLVLFCIYVIKICNAIKWVQDKKYMIIASLIPLTSVLVCCMVISNKKISLILSVIGVIILNALNLLLLSIEHKVYEQKVMNETLVSSYERQKKDFDEIRLLSVETDKTRHEINRVLEMLWDLMDNGEYEKAKDFLKEFTTVRKRNMKEIIYTGNVVLNNLLNRKKQECENKEITMNCLISGEITGIIDIDLYILLGNLIDNAIEASVLSEKKHISIMIYSDESTVGIEIGNSVKNEILKQGIKYVTTKDDKTKHGLGMKNVLDIVEQYNGKIETNTGNGNYLCRITLIKNINSRQK